MQDLDSEAYNLIESAGFEIDVQRAQKGTVHIHAHLNGEATRKASFGT